MEEEPTHPSPERDTPPHAAAATLPSLQLSENHQYGAPSQKKPVRVGGGGGKGSTVWGGVVRGVLCGGAIVAVGLASDVAVVSALRWVSAMHLYSL
jgi:hypothetical protein